MERAEVENLIISIENSASTIIAQVGPFVVRSVLQKYGTMSIEDLNPNDLQDVFSELFAIETDLK